ncbi:MAG: FAD binding domain-containing protein [Deltaproteobacteria bacterium]|nr:FAD binding domain-containing protein [Deltaproteobacteria bacterium]
MLLSSFDYHRPTSLDELFDLIGLIKSQNESFSLYGGGTDLIANLKLSGESPDNLISCSRIEGLAGVRHDPNNNSLFIGAMTRLADLCEDRQVIKKCPVIALTAKKIASPQIRFLATLGGNLLVNTRCVYFNQTELKRDSLGSCLKTGGGSCRLVKSADTCKARFVSDLAPVLILLGAKLHLKSADEERTLMLEEFYRPDGIQKNHLTLGEILSFIEIPLDQPPKILYEKLRVRDAVDFASLGVGVGWNGKKMSAALETILIGTDPAPVVARFYLKDFKDIKEMIEHASNQASALLSPLKQDFFPVGYRKKMARQLVEKMARELTGKP